MSILLHTVWYLCCVVFTFNVYSRDNTVAISHSLDKSKAHGLWIVTISKEEERRNRHIG
jgi:hypothetical protein